MSPKSTATRAGGGGRSSCSCGATCPKCSSRNPDRQSTSGILTKGEGGEAAAEAPAEAVAEKGGGGGGGPAAPPPARPAASARLRSGPRYTPNGNLTPTVAGGRKTVSFDFDGVFDSDPAAGVFPSCGEIHQDIKWNAAAATSTNALFGSTVPHGGFPAGHPSMVWIEDRDAADTRYGRRSGVHSAPSTGDEYTTGGVRDMRRGATYHGEDGPDVPAALTGRWQFMVLAFDMCNRGVQVGSADFITIDW